MGTAEFSPGSFSSFGEMLKYLRRRARLTQRDLGIAVGYSEAQVTRLEGESRRPDPSAVRAHFITALGLQNEPALAQRLIELADATRHSAEGGRLAPLANVPAADRANPHPVGNLPVQLSRFVGRERDIADVTRLLATTRLLTLTGSGGAGKTRLALKVGAALMAQKSSLELPALMHGFPHGAWLCALAPIADSLLVADTVAAAIGLHPAGRPALAVFVDYLREREALLILDNCEHLIQACAELAETLLHACPRLRILATSREALNIAGEITWRVPPLPRDDAVQLFAERAREAWSGFRLDEHNATLVAHICERLDGMPLAIELAAARLRAFSLPQIAARLSDRFRLLTGGSRTALPRHQTLRAMIDWSYNLLSEAEQRLLRQLSTFADGWTLEDAEALCGEHDTAAGLVQLVNKSLVVVEQRADGSDATMRYRLLETIRQYACEKSAEAGEVDQARQRHLLVFTGLAQEAGSHQVGPAQVWWLDRLEAELDNIRAALDWAARCRDTQAAEQLIEGVWWFWFLRAHLGEGIRWIGQLMLSDHVVDTSTRVKAYAWLGCLGLHKGEIAQSRDWWAAAVTPARLLGDARLLNLVLCGHGLLAADLREATNLLDEAARIAQQGGWKREHARALWLLGTRMRHEGDPQRAVDALTRGLALAREVGDRYLCSQLLLKLGLRALDRVDYVAARVLLEESVAMARELGAEVGIADALIELGTLGVRQAEFDLARPAIRECITAYDRAGNLQRLAQCVSMAAGIADAQGRAGHAARLLAATATVRGNAPRRFEFNSTLYEEYDRLLPLVRAELGPEAFVRAWAEGCALTLSQALAEALTV